MVLGVVGVCAWVISVPVTRGIDDGMSAAVHLESVRDVVLEDHLTGRMLREPDRDQFLSIIVNAQHDTFPIAIVFAHRSQVDLSCLHNGIEDESVDMCCAGAIVSRGEPELKVGVGLTRRPKGVNVCFGLVEFASLCTILKLEVELLVISILRQLIDGRMFDARAAGLAINKLGVLQGIFDGSIDGQLVGMKLEH